MKKQIKSKIVNKNGGLGCDPIQVNCFQCQKKVIVKWNKPRKKYSEKNSWKYWTENPENQGKYICDKDIFKLYYQNKTAYWKLIPSLEKRQVMRSYIYLKSLKVKD